MVQVLIVVMGVVGHALQVAVQAVEPMLQSLPHAENLHGAIGQHVLRPVLLTIDDQQQLAYDIERLADGRAVVFAPGSPDAWSGSVLVVQASRLQPLAIDPVALARSLQGIGRGLAALLERAGA